jgi:hypothetical protein
MHEALNIDKNNYLYNLYVICVINFFILVSPWLDNNYQIQTKCYRPQKLFTQRTKQRLIRENKIFRSHIEYVERMLREVFDSFHFFLFWKTVTLLFLFDKYYLIMK